MSGVNHESSVKVSRQRPQKLVRNGLCPLTCCPMKISERSHRSPLWALMSFVILAGILSMHGLTAHDEVDMSWMTSAKASPTNHAPSSESTQMSVMPITSETRVTSVTHVTWVTHVASVAGVSSGSPDAGHLMMDLCVAVLSLLLLLYLARAMGQVLSPSLNDLRVSLLRALTLPPPRHLDPSLTRLCINRV